MKKKLSSTEVGRKTFIKLIAASAILSVIGHVIYDYLRAEDFDREGNVTTGISININDLISSLLYEYVIFFFITFLFLFGVRFLYFSFVSPKTVTELP
jgi:cellobiose-specific phosphotransferase system component IIC